MTFAMWWAEKYRTVGEVPEQFFELMRSAYERGAKDECDECIADCRKIGAQYPTDIWPESGESLDCKSARMARLTAQNIERAITERSNDLAKPPGAALCGRSPRT